MNFMHHASRITHYQLGLIGYPLSHSLSPKIHTAALKACDLEGNYSLFPIHPEDKQGLKDFLNQVRAKQIHGLNVTIPHKQNVIEFIDELTPTAKSIGAVNTIYLKDEKLMGDNTDAMGFLTDLKKLVNKETSKQVNKSALVLGAGGSARAVIYALLNDGWNVAIASRRVEQAKEISSSFPNHASRITNYQLPITNLTDLQPSTFNLIINTTPIGMTPNINESPLPENLSLTSNIFIYDLVYNPRETKLIKSAKQNGNHATTGLGMLIEQAALSFEIWTGKKPPREILYQTVVE
ncbi:MAG: shikimate dehydrogenase [Chloroflexi bacterium OLB14]|nr:MAG: shikimate dehydrogenase [Chloroflexi bacterium OLB14]